MATIDTSALRNSLVWSLEECDTEQALRRAGFKDDTSCSGTLIWRVLYHGQEFSISASPWVEGWVVNVYSANLRTITDHHFKLPMRAAYGKLMSAMYWDWKDTFRGSPIPNAFMAGYYYEQFLAGKSSYNIGNPVLKVDQNEFIECLSVIHEVICSRPEFKPDTTVRLSFQDGELVMNILDENCYCAAKGNWYVTAECEFLYLYSYVPIEIVDQKITIGYRNGKLRVWDGLINTTWD